MNGPRLSSPRLIDITKLSIAYGANTVVRDLDLTLNRGEVLGLIGESGSGKSTVALSLLGLLPSYARRRAERFTVCDVDLNQGDDRMYEQLRGSRAAIIFQEPMTALNPTMRIGDQIKESLRIHRSELDPDGMHREVLRLLSVVHIPHPEGRARSFPHELSGGMRQRAMIAMALASQPRLLIADEPTTALDVTVQAQILDLLKEIQASLHLGILLITHNIAVVADICERVAVMYLGEIVEEGPVEEVLVEPKHPYTEDLLMAIPRLDSDHGPVASKAAVPGADGGCRYLSRCAYAQPPCSMTQPLRPVGRGAVRCWQAIQGVTAKTRSGP